ncbi:serine protease [Pelagibacteraceae bacterium]|nr:serine protease [Pelagibacteraceae bacterium]
MKKLLIIIIVAFPFSTFALDAFDIYKILNNSTVRITIWDNYNNDSRSVITWGTGVIINKINSRYFILTNAHVMLEKYCLVMEPTNNCEDKKWSNSNTITVDSYESDFEYPIGENFVWWTDHDLAIIAVDIEQQPVFEPIEIGGHYYPLMDVYGAGYPQVLGNFDRDYTDIVFCAGVVNTMFFDEYALAQLRNYSIAHSCALAGGMSGGPLVDNDGKLLGINGMSGVANVSEDKKGNLAIDIAPGRFDYAIDIWDLYSLEISSSISEEGHFNPKSNFYKYLPKLSYDYHVSFYREYIKLYPNELGRIKQLFE